MDSGLRSLSTLVAGHDKNVVVIVTEQETFSALLSTGHLTAELNDAYLVVFVVADKPPIWLEVPDDYDKSRIILEVCTDSFPSRYLLKTIKKIRPLLLGLTMDIKGREECYLAGRELDPLVHQASCPVYLVKCPRGWSALPDEAYLI